MKSIFQTGRGFMKELQLIIVLGMFLISFSGNAAAESNLTGRTAVLEAALGSMGKTMGNMHKRDSETYNISVGEENIGSMLVRVSSVFVDGKLATHVKSSSSVGVQTIGNSYELEGFSEVIIDDEGVLLLLSDYVEDGNHKSIFGFRRDNEFSLEIKEKSGQSILTYDISDFDLTDLELSFGLAPIMSVDQGKLFVLDTEELFRPVEVAFFNRPKQDILFQGGKHQCDVLEVNYPGVKEILYMGVVGGRQRVLKQVIESNGEEVFTIALDKLTIASTELDKSMEPENAKKNQRASLANEK